MSTSLETPTSTPEAIAAFATRRPVAVTVLAVAVVLVGWLSWQQLPVDLLPDLQSPTVAVSVVSGDRPPTEMERLYGEQLEQRLFTVRGIREVNQVARTGRLVATVTFDWDTDLELRLVDVQEAVGPMSADPDVDDVLVRRFDPRQAPVLNFGLVASAGGPDLAELRRLARRQLAPGLEQLPGVAEVRVTGGRDNEVRVLLDRYRLEAFGVSLAAVEQRLAAENVDISAGTLEEGTDVYLVRGMSRFRDAEDVARVVVRYAEGADGRQAIRISDLGEVRVVDQEIDHLVRVNGVEGVGLAIYKEAGSNTVAVSTIVRGALTGLADDLPSVDLVEVSDDAALVVDAVADLQTAAGIGILLAVGVLAAFLRSAGATLVVAAAVPVSIFAALFMMSVGSYSLNIVTLAGLALGAGMLVDNAIVVVESIFRRLADGDPAAVAAAKGTGEVAGAITASTLTTCVVFLPVLFVEGLAARLIEGIAFTVVMSLLASLAVAMLLIPALAKWFLPAEIGAGTATLPRYRAWLENWVRRLLRRPLLTVLVAAVLAALCVAMLLRLGTELLPPSDPRQFSVRIVGPAGQRVESTASVVEGMESLLVQASRDTVEAILSEVGRLPEDDRLVRTELTEENTARLTVRVSPTGPTGRELANQIAPQLAALEGTEISWEVGSSALAGALGTSGPPMVVEISGESLPDLRRGAETVKSALAGLDELWNVRSSFEGGPPELRIELDRAMADGLGVDLDTLGRVLEASLDGREVTLLATGDEERPVMIRLDTPRRENLAAVTFQTAQGRKVTVGEVAHFVQAEGAREVFRRDQRRTAQVTAQIADGVDQPDAVAAVGRALALVALPAGLTAEVRGDEEERERTFGELRLAGVLALVLVLMVLAGSFESLLHPITVLAAIPLGLLGVAAVLVPMGEPIGVMAMMGLIVLAGVAVNDAVLLLSTARRLMAAGTDRVDALVTAAGNRLRPILMTTMTTVLVLLPLVVGTDEGAALRAPMAMTIIGGVITSTIGSLLVLPCLFLVLDRLHPGRALEGET